MQGPTSSASRPSSTFRVSTMTFPRWGPFSPSHKKKMFTLLACKERIENEEIPSELLDVYKIQCKAEIDSARYVCSSLTHFSLSRNCNDARRKQDESDRE